MSTITPYTVEELQKVVDKLRWAEQTFLTDDSYNDASKAIDSIVIYRDEENDLEKIGRIQFVDGWIGFVFNGQDAG